MIFYILPLGAIQPQLLRCQAGKSINHYTDKDMLQKFITSFLSPTLDYAATVLEAASERKDTHNNKDLQRVVKKWKPSLKSLRYEERLRTLNPLKMEERRKREDTIMIYVQMGTEEIC